MINYAIVIRRNDKMRAGVVSVQGAAPEHVAALKVAMANLGLSGEVINVRKVQGPGGVILSHHSRR